MWPYTKHSKYMISPKNIQNKPKWPKNLVFITDQYKTIFMFSNQMIWQKMMIIDYLCLIDMIKQNYDQIHTQTLINVDLDFKDTHEEDVFQKEWNEDYETNIYRRNDNDDIDDMALTRDTCQPLIDLQNH